MKTIYNQLNFSTSLCNTINKLCQKYDNNNLNNSNIQSSKDVIFIKIENMKIGE